MPSSSPEASDGPTVRSTVEDDHFRPLHERWLVLHTGLAEAMFHGRQGIKRSSSVTDDVEWLVSPIPGLRQFGRQLRRIWLEAKRGDPYAHWWLIRVEEAFVGAERRLSVSTALYEERLKEASVLLVVKHESLEAYRHPVRFINPLGNRGANLLGKLDRLLAITLEAQQQALISKNDVSRLHRMARGCVLDVFAGCFGYKAFGITQGDVARQSERAQYACAHMGEVPSDILDGVRRAVCAPSALPKRFATKPKLRLQNQSNI